MKKLLLLLACLFACDFAYTQITFERSYAGIVFASGYSVCQTNDNGYIITGSKGISSGINRIWLLKTNEFGDTLWTKTLNGITPGAGYSVIQNSNGDFIIAGRKYNSGIGDVILIKTNANGVTLWTRTFGGTEDDKAYSVAQTFDGGYIITGYKTISSVNTDVYLIRTDTSGNALWAKTYGGPSHDEGLSVIQTSDSGFMVSGMIRNPDSSFFYNVYVIKTNLNGDTIWTKKYGGSEYDAGQCITKTNDGCYMIAGSTEGYGSTYSDVYMLKINDNGDTIWTKRYGGINKDFGYSISKTNDNGYIITGSTRSFGSGIDDVYLIKTNSTGDTLWTKTFGGSLEDFGSCVMQTNDSGYIITGMHFNVNSGYDELYLIATDENGNVSGINENIPALKNEINLYPNPTSGKINIQIPKQFKQTKKLELFDCIGQLQLTKTDNFSSIDLSSLKSGLYFIVLTNSVNEKITGKIIKE